MAKGSKKKDIDNDTLNEVNEESFWYKFKNDKQYNAKVQLMGYGIFILIVILGVNISSVGSKGSKVPSTNVIKQNTSKDSTNLLGNSASNYQYDVVMDVKYLNVNDEEVTGNITYSGKKYKDVMEFTKQVDGESSLYYKKDSGYYGKNGEELTFVKDDAIYDIVDADYIEVDNIFKLINKASLDHVTDYSSGRKEYVYHLKIKDLVVSYQMEDVIEFSITEENGVMKIKVDYSNLLKVIDKNVTSCVVEANISRVNEIKEDEIVFQDNVKDNSKDNVVDNGNDISNNGSDGQNINSGDNSANES